MIARRTLERTAWALGAVLLIAYGAVRAWAESERANAVATLVASTAASAGGGSLRQEYSASKADQSLWSARRKATFEALPERDETPDGLLRIPALSLLVPVFEGVNERNLTRGAARIESTAGLGDRGNVGIAAHRDGFFRRLKDAAPGQILEIQTRTQLMRYRITEIRIVEPTDVAVLGNTAVPSVTLVTCYPFYLVGPAPRRFIVRAEIEQGLAQSRSAPY